MNYELENENLSKLQSEYVGEQSSLEKDEPLAKVLIDLITPVSDRRDSSRLIKQSLSSEGIQMKKVPYKLLKKAYELIMIEHKRNKTKKGEFSSTIYEKKFMNTFRSKTGLKIINQHLIGNHFVDLFIPNLKVNPLSNIKSMNELLLTSMNNKRIGNPSYSGIVVEIDGGIHNDESKMLRDIQRDEFFRRLNLYVYRLENNFVLHTKKLEQFILKMLEEHTRADNKTIQNQMTRIYLATIAFLGQDDLFEKLFGITKAELRKYELRYRNFDKEPEVVYE